MALLWEYGPMFAREIIDRMPDPKPHFNTVSTFLRILESKGFVDHEKLGNSYRYFAAVDNSVLRKTAVEEVVDSYFGGSPKALISYLLESSELSDDDIWDLMDEMRQTRKR